MRRFKQQQLILRSAPSRRMRVKRSLLPVTLRNVSSREIRTVNAYLGLVEQLGGSAEVRINELGWLTVKSNVHEIWYDELLQR